MGHEANDWKNDKASENAGGAVGTGHYDGVPAERKTWGDLMELDLS